MSSANALSQNSVSCLHVSRILAEGVHRTNVRERDGAKRNRAWALRGSGVAISSKSVEDIAAFYLSGDGRRKSPEAGQRDFSCCVSTKE